MLDLYCVRLGILGFVLDLYCFGLGSLDLCCIGLGCFVLGCVVLDLCCIGLSWVGLCLDLLFVKLCCVGLVLRLCVSLHCFRIVVVVRELQENTLSPPFSTFFFFHFLFCTRERGVSYLVSKIERKILRLHNYRFFRFLSLLGRCIQ